MSKDPEIETEFKQYVIGKYGKYDEAFFERQRKILKEEEFVSLTEVIPRKKDYRGI